MRLQDIRLRAMNAHPEYNWAISQQTHRDAYDLKIMDPETCKVIAEAERNGMQMVKAFTDTDGFINEWIEEVVGSCSND